MLTIFKSFARKKKGSLNLELNVMASQGQPPARPHLPSPGRANANRGLILWMTFLLQTTTPDNTPVPRQQTGFKEFVCVSCIHRRGNSGMIYHTRTFKPVQVSSSDTDTDTGVPQLSVPPNLDKPMGLQALPLADHEAE